MQYSSKVVTNIVGRKRSCSCQYRNPTRYTDLGLLQCLALFLGCLQTVRLVFTCSFPETSDYCEELFHLLFVIHAVLFLLMIRGQPFFPISSHVADQCCECLFRR